MSNRTRDISGLLFWIALTFSAAVIGSLFQPGEWYKQLSKPALNPPDYIFAPVWTFLYILMAVSVWMVWKKHGFRNARLPIMLFLFQLILNAIWSWLFFGLHMPGLAFIEILILWLVILATTVSFWRSYFPAGIIMIPYLVWVTFAIYLNWSIWRMNI